MPFVAAGVAILLALPWLDERLVWCEWLGIAAGLAAAHRLRGLAAEAFGVAAAASALAAAFHWAPRSLASAMQAEYQAGLAAAAPVVLWDAVRLVAPFWLAGRLGFRGSAAWLPAALAAAAVEGFWPSVFPWKLGYVQAVWPVLVQSVDLFGPEFSTVILFAHAGAIVWGAERAGLLSGSGRPRLSAAAAILCLVNLAYGGVALASWESRLAAAPTVSVALVQADPSAPDGVATLRSLTAARLAHAPPPDLVCWPECSAGEFAVTLDSFADPDHVAGLARPGVEGGLSAGPPGAPLLCGGVLYAGHRDRPAALHQSALLVDSAGTVRGRYHKRHLMPFGEYVPLAEIWPELRSRFPLAADFDAGTEATVLAGVDGVRIGPMLCYEDMVPAAARSLVAAGANVFVSLVNDTCFMAPLTLRQHRRLAQLRAVECRRSLVRCAASGETCVIAPTGRITGLLPIHEPGTLDINVPLVESITPAVRLGPLFPAICGGILFSIAFYSLAGRS